MNANVLVTIYPTLLLLLMVIYTTPSLLFVALLPPNLNAAAATPTLEPLIEIQALVQPGQAFLDAIHPFLPKLIPATHTNTTTNDSTNPPEGPAAGHLRATNLRKSASADREGQV